MIDRSGVLGRVDAGGLVIALVGFLLSRFAVLETASGAAMVPTFLLGDGLSLVLGLGLAVAGVALAVSSHSTAYVNTVAVWCLLGVAGMGVLVGSVLLEGRMGGSSLVMAEGVPARILVGGAIGGAAIGAGSARSARQRRDLQRYADRLTVLNRILRHEVLNKVNVVRGYAGLDGGGDAAVIERNAEQIDRAIEEVGFLTQGAADGATVDLRRAVGEAVGDTRESFPDAAIGVGTVPADVSVRASDRLVTLLSHLLANAVEYGESARISATTRTGSVAVTVADDGPGLPGDAAALLTDRELPEYDDPTVGFGLTVVRLLVEEFDGRVTVGTGGETASGEGTEITVTLPRAGELPAGTGLDIDSRHLLAVGVGGIAAGTVMGVAINAATGSVAVIGALYGTPSPAVGWLTHLFHSVVFAVAFAALLRGSGHLGSWRPTRRSVTLGVGFGVGLWLFAAGVVMPIWLRAAGVSAALPNLTFAGLGGHVLWGLVVGAWVGELEA